MRPELRAFLCQELGLDYHHHHQRDRLEDERELVETAKDVGLDLVELAEHLETEDAADEDCQCRSSE